MRENDFNVISRCRPLANRLYVDVYVKVESERLRYISLNKNEIWAKYYIRVQDAAANNANVDLNIV